MGTGKEEKIFEGYLAACKLKHSQQRKEITDVFLSIDRHLTTDELYRIIKKKVPNIGYATVCRTLKLLCECGLCRELKFEDGTSRYEHLYEHRHHDHLICVKCGGCTEVMKPRIERLQDELAKERRFIPLKHSLQIFGICDKCS